MASIQLKTIKKSFGPVDVLKGIDIDIKDGEFVAFVGPSGCGKSTLLRLIAGLESITEGDLLIDETRMNDLSPKERGIAMVFQSYALYPHMSVYKNMAFGLSVAKKDKAQIKERVMNAARILQLEEYLDRYPRQLSGGQRQRVAIGRAIVRNPKVFLFDEPLSNLDAALRADMRVELARLHGDLKSTMIYVTHDQIEAMTLADKIVVLYDGMLQQVGTPLELYHQPANLFVAGFIGSPKMNLIKGKVIARDESGITLDIPHLKLGPVQFADAQRLEPGDDITLGIRPNDFSDKGGQAGELSGSVLLAERLGNETVVSIKAGDQIWTATIDGLNPVRLGDELTVTFDPQSIHLFDKDAKALERLNLSSLIHETLK
ncbi:MAG: sn-glycerol-3-phosphate ABC transporter ATP-binding protein UgpC [Cohaesibacter sp.]|nr:sn-glycerol-3-phosphate ABC transporter ATP-binding protein UgpC [Cohaesibacter sp.]